MKPEVVYLDKVPPHINSLIGQVIQNKLITGISHSTQSFRGSQKDGLRYYWNTKCTNCSFPRTIVTCKLYRVDKCKKCLRQPKGESGCRKLFGIYKSGAKKREIEFALTFDELKSTVSSNCHYCGECPNLTIFETNNNDWAKFVYNGIDRTNNSLGYIATNCVACCRFCNLAKHQQNEDEFKAYLQQIDNTTNELACATCKSTKIVLLNNVFVCDHCQSTKIAFANILGFRNC